MYDFWNSLALILFLGALFCLLWVFFPIWPFKRRARAAKTFGRLLLLGAFIVFTANEKAEESRLETEEPERYAALVAEREQRAKEAEAQKAKNTAEAEAETARQTAEAEAAAKAERYRTLLDTPSEFDSRLETADLVSPPPGSQQPKTLNLTLFNESVWSETSFIFEAATTFLKTARFVAETEDATARLEMVVIAPVKDRYGREDQVPALTLALPSGELEKINWENFTNWDLLNLTDVEVKIIGQKLAEAFCADDDNARYADDFCRRALR